MNFLPFLLLSLTNFHTVYPLGDLIMEGRSYPRDFSVYVKFSFNASYANEYRYEYVYDQYNTTVGRQIVYDKNNLYILKPDVTIGFSYWKFKTFLYFYPLTDGHYRYEKIIYNPSYVPVDTIKVERASDSYEGGLRVLLSLGGFGIGGSFGLVNKSDSLVKRGIKPELTLSFSSRAFDLGLNLSPKVKLSEEDTPFYPERLSLYGDFYPLNASVTELFFDLNYLACSKINSELSDYFQIMFGSSHTFRDLMELQLGGVLEKSYVGDYYIPGFNLGFGYNYKQTRLVLELTKLFYNYTYNNQLENKNQIVEESPLIFRLGLEFKK